MSATRYIILDSTQAQADVRNTGLPAISMNGIALAQTLYLDPALHPMSDLDVLVPYDRCEDALKVVQMQGYRFPDSPGRPLEFRGLSKPLVIAWARNTLAVGHELLATLGLFAPNCTRCP